MSYNAPIRRPAGKSGGAPAAMGVLAASLLASTAALAQSEPIKLGATATISGAFAGSCTKQVAGAKAWIDKVNAEGGVNGRQIEWTVLDDGADPQRGVSNTRRLINEGVVAFFDNCGSAGTVASLPEVERAGIPNLFVNSVSDAILHPVKETTYTLLPLFDQQLAAVVLHAMREKGPGTAAVVYLDGFSPNIAPAAKYAAEAAGGSVVLEIPAPGSTSNWGPTVIRLKEANPDYVFIAHTTPGSGQLVAEMANQGFAPGKGIAGAYQMADAIFMQFAGAAGNGVVASSPAVVPTDPKAAECNATLPSGETPSFYSLLGCASAKLMVEVLKAAGDDVTPATVLEAVKGVWDTQIPELGSIAYSDDHLLNRSLYMWELGVDGPSMASPEPTEVPASSNWIR